MKNNTGLPDDVYARILIVKDEYRKNNKSFEDGGTDIVVVNYKDQLFTKGKVLLYDKIKNPKQYIAKIFANVVESNIHQIYLKVYKTDSESKVAQFSLIYDGKIIQQIK